MKISSVITLQKKESGYENQKYTYIEQTPPISLSHSNGDECSISEIGNMVENRHCVVLKPLEVQ